MPAAHHPNTLFRKASGFSIIEVLITLLVFWLGILGIGLYTASGIRDSAVTQVRATVFNAGTQSIEPLLYQSRADCLATALQTFPMTVTSDNGKDTYDIRLASAFDGTGTAIVSVAGAPSYAVTLNTASSTWVSPITVNLVLSYTGPDGNPVTTRPVLVIPLQSYTINCNA